MKMSCFGISIVVFMSMVWSVAFASGHADRLKTYQEEIKGKDSGVYEVGDDLYIHARIPRKKNADIRKVKYKAVFVVKDLLRKWVIDYGSERRNADGWKSEGLEFAGAVLTSANPMWRFFDFNLKFSGQEFSGFDDNVVWLGQVVSKTDVINSIPQSYFKKPDKTVIHEKLKFFIPEMLKQDKVKTYSLCCVVDLNPTGNFSEKTRSEFETVNSKVKAYLATSQYAKDTLVQRNKIQRLGVTEFWNVVPCDKPEEIVEKKSEIITNMVVCANVITNFSSRIQTEDERLQGFSEKGRVDVLSYVSEEKEIIETIVEKVTMKKRSVLQKKHILTVGFPRFQEIFLSGGESDNEPSSQTELGRKAVRMFFQDGVSLEDKDRILYAALSENPGDCELWNLWGRCFLFKKDYVAALICFRSALKLDSANEYVLTNLAITYNKLGCKNLGYGYVTLILGTSENNWCVNKSKEILSK